MECYSIVNNDGIIISCNDEFTTCTGLTYDDNILNHYIDKDNKDNELIKLIKNININNINKEDDINPIHYSMITDDGWKYLIFITNDILSRGIKINIPYQNKTIRLGSFKDHVLLQSDLCLSHNVKHLKILMVDDSLVTCKIAKKLIESTSSICDTVCDARQFIGFNKDLLTNYYNIILVDINMPYINGYELCKVLRPFLPRNVHLIGTSTDTSDTCTNKCIDVGFTRFLSKPFCIANIVDMIYMYKVSTTSTIFEEEM
jgi:CheY-like chemotaxis protein